MPTLNHGMPFPKNAFIALNHSKKDINFLSMGLKVLPDEDSNHHLSYLL